MIKGVSDSLSVQQRSPSVVAATLDRQQDKPTFTAPASALSPHRLRVYQQWANVTRGQHTISASQVAEQGMRHIMVQLTQLNRLVKDAQSCGGDQRAEKINEAVLLQDHLAHLHITYQHKPLLDHQFNLISAKRPSSPRQFVLRSIELAQPKSRQERILIQVDAKSVAILLPAQQTQAALRAVLAPKLAQLAISIAPSAPASSTTSSASALTTSVSTTRYLCDQACWQKISAGIMMTGQGQRLPAGEARIIKVDEQLSWQDPREWGFNSNAELKHTTAKIDKSLFKLQQQLRELNQSSSKIQRQLQRAHTYNAHELEQMLLHLAPLMQANPFSLQMRSIMAQANVTRLQVSSLLE
ncbi:hypothetical protein HQQ94_01890 [Shewanella sp. VB17]|uniref:hypothetical protein n=1 Tax=Shewanella sp. VB17 TaxID=2739432 RepID=UPI001564DACD|nr:hypothetical protein [Shewanella sp. VB17]NRD72015.1 hypothetical protein [Shewanella sp. VB17]